MKDEENQEILKQDLDAKLMAKDYECFLTE
jgi:hypothetical protein